MDKKITYKMGFFFPGGGLVFGSICFLFALPIMFTDQLNIKNILISSALIIVGLTFFSKKYLIIDKDNNTVENQTKCLGFTSKDTKKLDSFCYITVIRQLYSITSRTVINQDITSKFGQYDVLLINKPHHLKQKIGSFDSFDIAISEAKKLSTFLGYEVVKFDPVRTRKKK